MAVDIVIQPVTSSGQLPSTAFMEKIAKRTLLGTDNAEITIRITDEHEIRTLNSKWRNVDKATNVLSFPLSEGTDMVPALMGDVVICAPVILREAIDLGIQPDAHWAHMIVHGILHLMGYDHEDDVEAREMETLEMAILGECGFPDPYAEA